MDAAASVHLTTQNDCPRLLVVADFALTSGEWDPAATPVLGRQVTPGTTGGCRAVAPWPTISVAGSLSLVVAQAGVLRIQWALSLTEPFAASVAKERWNAPDVDATHVVNPGDYAHVWLQVLVTAVVTVRLGQTLDEIAQDAGVDPAVLIALNHLESVDLRPGRRLLVPRLGPAFRSPIDEFAARRNPPRNPPRDAPRNPPDDR